MKQQPLNNRRVRPRIDVLLKANFEINGKEFSETGCIIANISVSGAGLVFPGFADGSVSKGQIISLEFFMPGSDRHIYAQGEIIWAKQLEDAISAGVNFAEPLSFEEIIKCCVEVKKEIKGTVHLKN
jgi:hypothetical protein